MTDRELMQQALDALEVATTPLAKDRQEVLRAQAALRKRLAQPDAYGYASRLAVAIWEQHYRDAAPQWKPLDDLMGVLTQIDNMTSGLTRLAQPEQKPMTAIRLLTDQCAALIRERDELQKQVWRYEKNGVTCQTYRHKVEQSCSECNVQENYTSPPQRKPLTDEEIRELADKHLFYQPEGYEVSGVFAVARAIEAAHGIKENT